MADQYKILVPDSEVALRIFVDGKKFNAKKDFLFGGEHTIAVSNVLYLSKWWSFLYMLADFVCSVFGGLTFGEKFYKQGSVRYDLQSKGVVDGDVTINVNENGIAIDGLLNSQLLASDSKNNRRVERILKHYYRICSIVFAIVFFVFFGALITWGYLDGWLI